MKYLGVDYGTKRVGIALSDEDATFAFPHSIVESEGAIKTVVEIAHAEEIAGIVMGYSVASNGVTNEVALLAEKFRAALADKVGVPIVFEREDFSTVEAHRYQVASGHRDDSAAAIILQRFLDRKGYNL